MNFSYMNSYSNFGPDRICFNSCRDLLCIWLSSCYIFFCGVLSCLDAAIHNIRSPSCWPRIWAEPKTFKSNGFLAQRIEKVYAQVCPGFLAQLKKCVFIVVSCGHVDGVQIDWEWGKIWVHRWEGFAHTAQSFCTSLCKQYLQYLQTSRMKGYHSIWAKHLNQWRVKKVMTTTRFGKHKTKKQPAVFQAKLVEPNTPFQDISRPLKDGGLLLHSNQTSPFNS